MTIVAKEARGPTAPGPRGEQSCVSKGRGSIEIKWRSQVKEGRQNDTHLRCSPVFSNSANVTSSVLGSVGDHISHPAEFMTSLRVDVVNATLRLENDKYVGEF